MLRTGFIVLMASGVGCGPQVAIGDTEAVNDDGSGGDADDDGNLSASEAGGADEGGAIEGGSCAGLSPDGPTIGGGEPGPSGFPPPCSPRVDGGPVGAYTCCSDDPAAEGGALPAYQGRNVPDGGTPYFSGANNALSTSGACVKSADIPPGSGLVEAAAANCPIPCDPTWSADAMTSVCGSGRICCQTQPLQRQDCVIDPTSGRYRPVDGTDVGATHADGTLITTWAPAEHATHQDPGGQSCLEIAGDDLSGSVFSDCVRNLHVAHRRGFCMALQPGQLCPLTAMPTACDLLNPD